MEILTIGLAYIGALSLSLCILRLAFWLTDLYFKRQIEKDKKELDELNSNDILKAITDLKFRIKKLENQDAASVAKEVKRLMDKTKV